jgi:hypothetical protein
MSRTPTTPSGQSVLPGSGGRHGPQWVCRGQPPLPDHAASADPPHNHLQPCAQRLALHRLFLLLLVTLPCPSALAEPQWGTNYYRADPPRGESFSVDPAPRQPSQWSGNRFNRPPQERNEQSSFPQRPPSARQWPEDEEPERMEAAPPRVGELPHDWRNEDFNQPSLPRQRENDREPAPRAGYRDTPYDGYREGYREPPASYGYGRALGREDPPWVPSDRDLLRDRGRWQGPTQWERAPREYEPTYEGEHAPSSNSSLRRRYPPNTYQSGEQWWEQR